MSASGGDRSGLGIIRSASSNYDGIGAVIVAGIMGFIINIYRQGINATTAISNIVINPLGRLGTNLGNLVDAYVGGAAAIINQGVETTVLSIAPGATWAVGPLTAAVSILVVGSMLFAMAWILEKSPTSNIIPFSFTDVPFIGVNEGDEELEE